MAVDQSGCRAIKALVKYSNFRWGSVILVLVALGSTILGLLNMQTKLAQSHTAASSDPVWVVSQLEFELIRFQKELLLYDRLDGSSTEAEIRTRFDILWSRHATLMQGNPRALIEGYQGVPDVLMSVATELERLDPLVQNLDSENVEKIMSISQDLDKTLHELSLSVLRAKSAESSAMRLSLLDSSRLIILLTCATGLASALVATLFWLDSRRHQSISKENRRLLQKSRTSLQEKSQFVSVVSHELRTPLTSIKGSLGLIRAGMFGQTEDGLKEMIEIAYNNSSRLSLLIDDLLDLEKAEAGKMEYRFKYLDLSELVFSVIEANNSYAELHDVEFRLIGELSPVFVYGDENRLMQVMANILSNAAKFSHKGSFVDIGIERAGETVRVFVKDYGIGIPSESRTKVFEKFAQIDASDRRQTGGTGLGMSISRLIVESHGGKIDFESKPGEGTTFHIDLSVADVSMAMAAQ